jgi:putative methionine-R-sulfoxide reductase with GAF domain
MPPGTVEQLSTNLYDFEAGFNKVDRTPFFASDTNGDGSLEQSAIAKLTTKPWQVAFIQSQSVLFAPATAQTTINLLAALAVASLIGIAGYFFSQTLSGPIVRLTQIAEAISGGDINLQATVETKDEVGTLAEAFNRMTHQLRDFIANLEERVAARTKDLATVAEVGTATATILETQKLLQAVVDLTKERFNLYHSHIYLLDDDGKNLVLAAGAGEPGRIMVEQKRFIPLDREQSLVARAARERNGVTVNDVREAPDFLPNPLLPNTRSELAVPMIVGGMVIGVFDIQSDQIGRFTESDINIQTTLAAQISTSIQNVRSFEESRAQAELESLVNSISQKIQRATTVEDTLQTAVREIGVALGAIRVSANLQAGFADRNNGASQN